MDRLKTLLMLAAPLATAAGMLWSLVAVVRWRGVRRALAAVPLGALVIYVSVVVVPDVAADPTSHNLLPFELGIWFCPSLAYMALLAGIRRSRDAR